MFKRCLTLFAAALVVPAAAGCVKIGDNVSLENSVPTISVTGNGKVNVVPDEASATFGVRSEERSLSKAYRKNTESMNAVIAEVKALGVDPGDMQTSSYSVTPVYPRDEKGHRIPGKPTIYRVEQLLTVKILDLSKTGEVIDKVMAAGSNTFKGVWFDSSAVEDLREQAKVLAARDAKSRAGILAESLGVGLGRAIRVRESSSPGFPVPRKMMAFSENAPAGAPNVQAGSMDITASCSVVYEIVQ